MDNLECDTEGLKVERLLTVRVVFCWAEISGYMAACFRELASRAGIDPFVVALGSGRAGSGGHFDDSLLNGVSHRLLEPADVTDSALVQSLVLEQKPDVIVICGWFLPAYRQLLSASSVRDIPIVMTMDTPWWGTTRQWIGRLPLRRLLRRIDLMVVTGERSWQYATRLGIPQEKLRRGMYGVDYRSLSQCLQKRTGSRQAIGADDAGGNEQAGADTWPWRFLFAGRFAEEKAIDILLPGYQAYRQRVISAGETPWPLACCGTGPLKALLAGKDGVEDLGFVQPAEMREQLTRAGVFVLPSRFDPWPLALVEACAAGLPVIATEACGSAVEMIRSEYNGYLIPTGNVQALTDAMLRAHQEHDRLPLYGKRANQFAAAYSTEVWAERWSRWLGEL